MHLISKPLSPKTKVNMSLLSQWFASPCGQRLAACERRLIQQQFAKNFGSYALLYNALDEAPYVTQIRHQVRVGHADLQQDIQCQEQYWPIQPESIDMVVLQHSLEFACSPYDVLREAAKTVRAGGHIVITGVSPTSFFALGRWLTKNPWRQGRCLSARRVSEWLAVLGFQLEERQFAGYRPLCLMREPNNAAWIERYAHKKQWPLGNCYMLVARKMMQGSCLQPKRKLSLEKLMPLPTASARQSGRLDTKKYDD